MTKIDRRNFLKFAGLSGAGALGLSACGGSDPGSSGAGAASTGALSGTATLTTWGQPAEKAAFEKLAADFKAARGAEVKIEVLPFSQMRTVVDRRLQAGEAPDLFRVTYTDVGAYANSGVLADLSDSMPAGFGDVFLPALWAAVQSDGKPFGVPHHTDTSALVYNKSHFKKAGISDVPSTLETAWSWAEFVEVLKKLKAAKTGAAPFAFNYQLNGAYRWFNTLYQAGGTLLNQGLDAAAIDTPEARKALEWTRDLYTKGLHAPSLLVKRPTYPDEIFPVEKISMIQTGDFNLPALDEAIGDKFEWGVTHLMKDAGPAADLGGNAIVVTDGAKNPEVAAEFAKFLVTQENMAYWCEQTTQLPTRTELVDAKLDFKTKPELMPVFQQQATTIPDGLVGACTVPSFTGINQVLIDTMDQYLSDPGSSTDQMIQDLTNGIDKAIKAQG